jgi:hypothetical protein
VNTVEQPNHLLKDKIFKSKDIIVALKYFGASFDKLKTSSPERARALVIGYKAWKLGLNETQLRSVCEKTIDDKEIITLLEYKEKKSIRSWSISTKIKEADYAVKIGRMWSKKLGAICLIAGLGQKELIELAKTTFKDELDCSIPKEF